MKISDIIGTKSRADRDSRRRSKHRAKRDNLYTVDISSLTEGADSRIQHVEDLVLWNGIAGAKEAISTLRKLETNTNDVTIKWDGSPAVIFGRNEKGEFVLTDKSGFGASGYDGKVTSADDLAKMLANRKQKNPDPKRPQFIEQMRKVWSKFEAATPRDFRGYVHGDLLYFDTPKENKGRLIFQPNTTQYSVDPRSEIGKKIANSTAGVVLHAHIDLDGNTSDVDASRFLPGELLIMPPAVVSHTPEIDVPELDRLEDTVNRSKGAIEKLLTVPQELRMKNFNQFLYTYINNSAKAGDLNDWSLNNFANWVDRSNLSNSAKQKALQWAQDNEQGFVALFDIIHGIMKVKNAIIRELDSKPADIQATTGGNPGGEGYVIGRDRKLVNRDEFTKNNMTRER